MSDSAKGKEKGEGWTWWCLGAGARAGLTVINGE